MEDRLAFADSRTEQWHELIKKISKRNPLGLSQCVLYFLAVFWGLLVEIPFGITLRDFDGRCILFAEIIWDNSIIWPWKETSCEYVLYVTLAVTFFYGISMACFTLLAVLPRQNERYESFHYLQTANVMYVLRALNPVFVVVNFIVCLLLLAVAVVLTAGFAKFCTNAMTAMQEEGYPVRTCIDVQRVNWKDYPIEGGRDDGPRGYRFNTCLGIAVVGAWGGFVTWLLQLILNFSLLCRGCTCMVAEEKQPVNKSMIIAARRSRLATPIGTPGHMTPRPYPPPGMMYGPPGQYPQYARGPPSQYSQGPPSQYSRGPPSQYSQGPPSQYSRGPPSQYSQGPPSQYSRGPPSQYSQGPPSQYSRGPPSQFSQGPPRFPGPPPGSVGLGHFPHSSKA